MGLPKTYRITPPHRHAMRAQFLEWCDEAAVVHWHQQSAELPDWRTAVWRHSGSFGRIRNHVGDFWMSQGCNQLFFSTTRTTASIWMMQLKGPLMARCSVRSLIPHLELSVSDRAVVLETNRTPMTHSWRQ
jgi:hypothetical protein